MYGVGFTDGNGRGLMANFEDWKQKLTIDDALKIFTRVCTMCPANGVCIEIYGYTAGTEERCKYAFFKWARENDND